MDSNYSILTIVLDLPFFFRVDWEDDTSGIGRCSFSISVRFIFTGINWTKVGLSRSNSPKMSIV